MLFLTIQLSFINWARVQHQSSSQNTESRLTPLRTIGHSWLSHSWLVSKKKRAKLESKACKPHSTQLAVQLHQVCALLILPQPPKSCKCTSILFLKHGGKFLRLHRDSLTRCRLLPADLLSHPLVEALPFIPVASTGARKKVQFVIGDDLAHVNYHDYATPNRFGNIMCSLNLFSEQETIHGFVVKCESFTICLTSVILEVPRSFLCYSEGTQLPIRNIFLVCYFFA